MMNSACQLIFWVGMFNVDKNKKKCSTGTTKILPTTLERPFCASLFAFNFSFSYFLILTSQWRGRNLGGKKIVWGTVNCPFFSCTSCLALNHIPNWLVEDGLERLADKSCGFWWVSQVKIVFRLRLKMRHYWISLKKLNCSNAKLQMGQRHILHCYSPKQKFYNCF